MKKCYLTDVPCLHIPLCQSLSFVVNTGVCSSSMCCVCMVRVPVCLPVALVMYDSIRFHVWLLDEGLLEPISSCYGGNLKHT